MSRTKAFIHGGKVEYEGNKDIARGILRIGYPGVRRNFVSTSTGAGLGTIFDGPKAPRPS